MSKNGFIKVDRGLFRNSFWTETRVYSRAEAWIDLIQSARFEAKQEFIKNKMIDVQRGEVPISLRYLENRWKWGNTKVRNYLKMLTDLGMITSRQHRGQTIVTLVKYEDFNGKQQKDNTLNNTVATHQQHSSNTNLKNLRNKELNKTQRVENFLIWFNLQKKKHTGKKGKYKMLSKTDENNLFKLLGKYDYSDFEEAIPKMFDNDWAKESNNQTPTHFLRNDNFNKYLNAEIKKPKIGLG